MALANLGDIDKNLTEIYAEQVTTNTTSNAPYEDKSKILFDQMQMIAFNNKMFLKLP